MVTTWASRCGVAEYSRYLIEALSQTCPDVQVDVLCPQDEGLWFVDSAPSHACWKRLPSADLSGLREIVLGSGFDIVHFQVSFGFFELPDLAGTIHALKKEGKRTILTFHSTADICWDGKPLSLGAIRESLAEADLILVHTSGDEERLASFGLRRNVRFFPHGVLTYPAEERELRRQWGITLEPVIGTFGFLLPHKGILELLEATSILRKEFPNLGLMAQCALHSDPLSRQFEAVVVKKIEELDLTSCVLFSTEFVSPAEATLFLQLSDVVVLPYRDTRESTSAAVRFALASGRPVITTKLEIFRDVAESIYQVPSADAQVLVAGIREVLKDRELAAILARRARQYADSRDWRHIGTFYRSLLNAIAQGKEPPCWSVAQPETTRAVVPAA